MTAGIDVALALIEEDLGAAVARKVARMMVVYYRRPGGQMQYSSLLDLDPGSDRIRRVLSFAREHLARPLTVDELAEVAHLSVRQFSRAFVAATGLTPAKAVERLRLEATRPLVEENGEAFGAHCSVCRLCRRRPDARELRSRLRPIATSGEELRSQSGTVRSLTWRSMFAFYPWRTLARARSGRGRGRERRLERSRRFKDDPRRRA